MLDFEYVDSWELSSTKADLLVRGRIRPSLVAQGRPPDQTQGSNLTQQSALPPEKSILSSKHLKVQKKKKRTM